MSQETSLKEKKTELEHKIVELINKFNEDTGLTVVEIDISTITQGLATFVRVKSKIIL